MNQSCDKKTNTEKLENIQLTDSRTGWLF